MFFILSKILDFLITPVIWSVGLLVFSLLSKTPGRKKIALIASLSVLLFFSNSFILDEFMRLWEIKTISRESIKKPFDYGIVLGGMITFDSKFDRVNFIRSLDRIMQAVSLYKEGKIKKIVITSGTGSLKEPAMQEAAILKNYFVKIGFPEEDILAEPSSRNTHENAVNTARMIGTGKENTYLLITSAYHMRRSMGCFEKAGFHVVPYVADRYAGPRKFYPDHLLLPNADALQGWYVLLHEMFGYLAYKAAGYI